MNKKAIIVGICVAIILIAGIGFWKWENEKKTSSMPQEQVKQQGQLEHQDFVVDVDSDVSHWQTKETEFFTIKFPKEWYWLESDREKTGYYSYVITNNPNFDINKYADIAIFTGGDYPSLVLANDTEAVISFDGSATSDAGTPQDSMGSIFELAKKNNPSVDCGVSNNKIIPFTAHCTATYNSQLQQSYYVINREISITSTTRTTKDTLAKKEILDKIADSIILK